MQHLNRMICFVSLERLAGVGEHSCFWCKLVTWRKSNNFRVEESLTSFFYIPTEQNVQRLHYNHISSVPCDLGDGCLNCQSNCQSAQISHFSMLGVCWVASFSLWDSFVVVRVQNPQNGVSFKNHVSFF